jgi:hypothetical protein
LNAKTINQANYFRAAVYVNAVNRVSLHFAGAASLRMNLYCNSLLRETGFERKPNSPSVRFYTVHHVRLKQLTHTPLRPYLYSLFGSRPDFDLMFKIVSEDRPATVAEKYQLNLYRKQNRHRYILLTPDEVLRNVI